MFALVIGVSWSGPLKEIKAIQLSWVAPILDMRLDSVVKITGSSKMYFYEDIILHENEDILIHDNNKQEEIPIYWMYKQDQKKGIRYEGALRDTIGIIFDVDSFLVKNAFKTFPFYDKESNIIFSKKKSKDKEELVEKYILKSRPDNTYPDTIVFRYSKAYLDIPFSFSTEIEKGKNRRVIEIFNIFNPVVNSKYKGERQTRIMSFHLEKITVDNPTEKMLYFEKFRKSIRKLE